MLRLVAVAAVSVVVVTADSRQVNVFTSLPSSPAATALNSRHISICPPRYTYRRVDFESCNRLTLARFRERTDFLLYDLYLCQNMSANVCQISQMRASGY